MSPGVKDLIGVAVLQRGPGIRRLFRSQRCAGAVSTCSVFLQLISSLCGFKPLDVNSVHSVFVVPLSETMDGRYLRTR